MTIAELYPKYFDEIFRFVRSMCRDGALSEDVAQETFLRALKCSDTVCALPESKVRAWLYTTARRVFIDQCRREKNRPIERSREGFEDDLSSVVVNGLLDVLPTNEREIFVLRHFSGYTSEEIGSRLSMPAATVRTKLRAAAKKLRNAYEHGGEKHV